MTFTRTSDYSHLCQQSHHSHFRRVQVCAHLSHICVHHSYAWSQNVCTYLHNFSLGHDGIKISTNKWHGIVDQKHKAAFLEVTLQHVPLLLLLQDTWLAAKRSVPPLFGKSQCIFMSMFKLSSVEVSSEIRVSPLSSIKPVI